jgi:hypothetical protein
MVQPTISLTEQSTVVTICTTSMGSVGVAQWIGIMLTYALRALNNPPPPPIFFPTVCPSRSGTLNIVVRAETCKYMLIAYIPFYSNITYCSMVMKVGILLKNYIFWGINSCSPLGVNRRYGEIFRLFLQVRRISQELCLLPLLPTSLWVLSWLYSSTLKTEATFCPEMFLDFQRNARSWCPRR